MTARHDAGCAAAGTVLAVERIGGERTHSRGTTGAIRLMPESVNVVSEIAEVVAEFRSPDDDWLARARESLSNAAGDEARTRGAGLELFWLPSEPPVRLASDLIDVCEDSATERGYAVLRMYSAAEHDTAFMARMFPSAMIFIPSKDGRSHCPDEWSDGSDIAAGAQTLVDSIVRLDATAVA